MRWQWRSRKGYVVALQWLLIGVVAVWGAVSGAWRVSPTVFWALIALASLVTLRLMRTPLPDFYRPAQWTYLFVTDTVFLGAAIYCMAGFDVDLYLPYFLILLVAALSTSIVRSVLAAVGVSIIYTVLMWREGGGVSVLEASFMIRLPFFFVVAIFTSYLAQGTRLHEESMQASRILVDQVRSLQQLAAGIAHEIRNPLTAMSNSLQMLVGSLPDRQEARELAEDALGQVKRMERIIQETLDLARPPNLKTVWLDINSALERAVSDVMLGVPKGLIEIKGDFTAQPCYAWADELLLVQMFSNVIRNAVEAMPRGGTVSLATRVEPLRGREQVVIRIRDTGGGIPPHQVARLFHPFFTTKSKGTGLGLSLARKYAHAHGGEIGLEINQGEGTTVRMELPVSGPALVAAPVPPVEIHGKAPARS
jgi:signal transduction histidine kinase